MIKIIEIVKHISDSSNGCDKCGSKPRDYYVINKAQQIVCKKCKSKDKK